MELDGTWLVVIKAVSCFVPTKLHQSDVSRHKRKCASTHGRKVKACETILHSIVLKQPTLYILLSGVVISIPNVPNNLQTQRNQSFKVTMGFLLAVAS